MAQVDYFLKLDGISGESLNPDYKENIDVESWSWGVSNSGNAIGRAAGGGAGKVSAQDIHFTVPFSFSGERLRTPRRRLFRRRPVVERRLLP